MKINRAAGFTLIEVMISLLIMGLAATAIFTSFSFQHKSYLIQNAIAEMQENLRGGMQFLDIEARNAGAGIPPTVALKLPSMLLGGGTISMISGLGISDGGAAGSDNLYIISLAPTATQIADSMPNASAEIKVVDPAGFQVGMIAIIFDSTNADVFQVTQVQASNHIQHNPAGLFGGENKDFSKAYGEGSTVALINYSGYYVDTTTDPAHPKLMRTIPGDNTLTPQIVADDIEDMQIQLVLDDGTEQTGAGMDNATLQRVRQLRIYLAARTSIADPKWSEPPRTWSNHTTLSSALTAYTNHRRRYYEQLIDLRNTGLSP
jgi:prepilin-type N-terminal cleavage/methylation domain-containing protein